MKVNQKLKKKAIIEQRKKEEVLRRAGFDGQWNRK